MAHAPFGRYLLLEPLAEGGMAQVFRAVLKDASGFEKQVALKRMHRELTRDPQFVKRFIDEARIASTLSHSNIVQVFDFGQEAGEYFIAMELVRGPDLSRLLQASREQGQPIPIPTALHVAAQIARGLGAAHGRSDEAGRPAPVVHRDVSPQNVLLSHSGEVKVVDFGIAKAADQAIRTRTGIVMGKCRYMAPEQAQGDTVDPRADIYSAGCILFELLTGRPLFDGESVGTIIELVLTGVVPAASTINPEVPPEIDDILQRSLSRSRDQRYPDGDALARDLEKLLHRLVPDYSRDDLAALVRVLSPPPGPALGWEAAATSMASIGEDTPLGPGRPPSAHAPGGAPAPAAVIAPPRHRTAHRHLLIGVLLGLLGLTAGAVGRHLLAGTSSTPLLPGRPIQHGGWTIELQERQLLPAPDGARLLLQLQVRHQGPRLLEAARFFALDTDRPRRPLFVVPADRAIGQLTMAFAASAPVEKSLLRFLPPGAPPLLLDLALPR